MEETEQLFKLLVRLKEKRATIIYITHRLSEIYRICDRVSIFRDGERILTAPVVDMPEDEMVSAMLGRKLASFVPKIETKIGEKVLAVRGLKYGNTVKNVSFSVRRGEIVGLVGSVGAGKSETLDIIFGSVRPQHGEVTIDGEIISLSQHNPMWAVKKGIAYIPEDRQSQGLVLDYFIRENLTLVDMQKVAKNSFISRKRETKTVEEMIRRLMIRPPEAEYTVSSLSGGNQQKVSIGKWFLRDYGIYLFDEITTGVDIGAKAEIYKMIGSLVEKGCAVVIATSDIMEAMNLCDRMVILHRGCVIREVQKDHATMQEVLLAMMGNKNDAE
jgi:simple sugar transport system ATP-binding protein